MQTGQMPVDTARAQAFLHLRSSPTPNMQMPYFGDRSKALFFRNI